MVAHVLVEKVCGGSRRRRPVIVHHGVHVETRVRRLVRLAALPLMLQRREPEAHQVNEARA